MVSSEEPEGEPIKQNNALRMPPAGRFLLAKELNDVNARQQKFCDYYLQSGNATEAAIKAGYSRKTARAIGAENLTKLDIQKYISDHAKKLHTERIATAEEVLEFWASVMRDKEVSHKDRLRASENLGKRYRLLEPEKDETSAKEDAPVVQFIFKDTSMTEGK